MKHYIKLIPLMVLMLILIAFFHFRLYEYLTFSALKEYRSFLMNWTYDYPIFSGLVFMGVYILAVAVSVPNAVMLTLASGFLFGPFLGTFYVVVSATIGASIIFFAAKTALHDLLYQKAGNKLDQFSKGFQKNAISYLLFLRLIPLFPFWLVNIAPALLNVRFRDYFIATFIGIIPGSFVYVLLGNGLGALLEQGKTPDLNIIFEPVIFIPIAGLAVLSLLPLLYKYFRR